MRREPAWLLLLIAFLLSGAALSADPSSRYRLSPVSALPLPGPGGINRPAGEGAGLRVLPWAGFEGASSFTFDDSQPSQIEHWPELKSCGIRMTFYVIGGWARPGDEAVLRDIEASGSELGNHTWSHRNLALPHADISLDRELDQCSFWIIHNLHQYGVWTMAYPYQRPEWTAHFRGQFLLGRMDSGDPISPHSDTDPLLLPAWPAPRGTTAAIIKQRLDAAADTGRWAILTFHTLLPSRALWTNPVPLTAVTAGVDYGLAGGRLWLDSLVNVGSYWWAEKLFESSVPKEKGKGLLWTWNLPASFPPGKYLRVTINGGRLVQNNELLPWNSHGFYEVKLDAGELLWLP